MACIVLAAYYTYVPSSVHAGITIGRAPEVTTKTQKLKATVCLAEDFPLDLRDQVMPIIDLMVCTGLYIRGLGVYVIGIA